MKKTLILTGEVLTLIALMWAVFTATIYTITGISVFATSCAYGVLAGAALLAVTIAAGRRGENV